MAGAGGATLHRCRWCASRDEQGRYSPATLIIAPWEFHRCFADPAPVLSPRPSPLRSLCVFISPQAAVRTAGTAAPARRSDRKQQQRRGEWHRDVDRGVNRHAGTRRHIAPRGHHRGQHERDSRRHYVQPSTQRRRDFTDGRDGRSRHYQPAHDRCQLRLPAALRSMPTIRHRR